MLLLLQIVLGTCYWHFWECVWGDLYILTMVCLPHFFRQLGLRGGRGCGVVHVWCPCAHKAGTGWGALAAHTPACCGWVGEMFVCLQLGPALKGLVRPG